MCNKIPHATKQLVTKCLLSSAQFLQFPLLELEYFSFQFSVLFLLKYLTQSTLLSLKLNLTFSLLPLTSCLHYQTISLQHFSIQVSFFLATAKSSCSAFLFCPLSVSSLSVSFSNRYILYRFEAWLHDERSFSGITKSATLIFYANMEL